jgi:signal transduction histidine kinase
MTTALDQARGRIEALEAQLAASARALSESNNREQVALAERDRSDAALRQAWTISATGRLTAGVAHDFNNLLATVLGCLELMERRLLMGADVDPERLRVLAERASETVERGARLMSPLLACCHRQRLGRGAIDPNRVIGDLLAVSGCTLGRRIRVTAELAEEPVFGPRRSRRAAGGCARSLSACARGDAGRGLSCNPHGRRDGERCRGCRWSPARPLCQH